MAINFPVQTTFNQYINVDGSTVNFDYTFYIPDETSINVYLTPPGQDPQESDLITTGFSVSGVDVEEGGTVTFLVAPLANSTITLERNVPNNIDVNFAAAQNFSGEALDFQLFRLILMLQQITTKIDTTILRYTNDALINEPRQNILPTLDEQRSIWMRLNDIIVAVVLEENPDVSTLRAELALNLALVMGSELVGYFSPVNSQTQVNLELDYINVVLAGIQPVIQNSTFVTGDRKESYDASQEGWILADDGTIGNAASGATTRANADTEDLFTLWWNTIPDGDAPVSGGRGASASADFAANKTIRMPLTVGRTSIASGTGAGLSARTTGESGGEETHQLTVDELAAHTHTAAQAGSENVVSGDPGFAAVESSTGSAGGDQPHNNMQPFSVVNVLIKL